MTPAGTKPESRPDYGLDAPGVVRNLFVLGGLCVALVASVRLGAWSGVVATPKLAGVELRFPLGSICLWMALGLLGMGTWMVWESRVGKVRGREALLDRVAWKGDEQVVDVGCGRGLMLIGAAKRLTTGRATGVDIWQSEDLSGNRPEATLENARREGVLDRVEVKTADMRKLPFPDESVDVVVSSAAIHNIYTGEGRTEAIFEIARVLKPGGSAVIDDIRHGGEYRAAFEARSCEVKSAGSPIGSLVLTLLTFGSLRPATLVARKGAARRAG
ncbi:MAG: class I SAM-dependent methyltransferase [Acidobacteriota bacterium]